MLVWISPQDQLVTQTYLFNTTRKKYGDSYIKTICCLCGDEPDDLQHFILKCPKLENVRRRHLRHIKSYLDNLRNDVYQEFVTQNNLLQLILDCTNQQMPYISKLKKQGYIELDELTRNMCYNLHMERMRQLKEGGAGFYKYINYV